MLPPTPSWGSMNLYAIPDRKQFAAGERSRCKVTGLGGVLTHHKLISEIDIMVNHNEAEIENEINEKGLNAPRLNPQLIDSVITAEQYHVFPNTTMTVCALTLLNGYIVIGESAAASPENFDAAIGRKIARENARNKIWALEGYLLRSKLSK